MAVERPPVRPDVGRVRLDPRINRGMSTVEGKVSNGRNAAYRRRGAVSRASFRRHFSACARTFFGAVPP